MIASSTQIREIFKISGKTLSNYHKRGAPQYKRGKWNLLDFFQWWKKEVMPSLIVESESLENIKKIYWAAKGHREELALQDDKDETILLSDAERQCFEAGKQVKESLYSMVEQLASLLASEDNTHTIKQLMRKHINRTLMDLSQSLKVRS